MRLGVFWGTLGWYSWVTLRLRVICRSLWGYSTVMGAERLEHMQRRWKPHWHSCSHFRLGGLKTQPDWINGPVMHPNSHIFLQQWLAGSSNIFVAFLKVHRICFKNTFKKYIVSQPHWPKKNSAESHIGNFCSQVYSKYGRLLSNIFSGLSCTPLVLFLIWIQGYQVLLINTSGTELFINCTCDKLLYHKLRWAEPNPERVMFDSWFTAADCYWVFLWTWMS